MWLKILPHLNESLTALHLIHYGIEVEGQIVQDYAGPSLNLLADGSLQAQVSLDNGTMISCNTTKATQLQATGWTHLVLTMNEQAMISIYQDGRLAQQCDACGVHMVGPFGSLAGVPADRGNISGYKCEDGYNIRCTYIRRCLCEAD